MKDVKEAMLDPKNLIYFGRILFDEGYFEASDIARNAKTMFDVTMAYALVFRTSSDFHICHELFKQALLNLALIKDNLSQVVDDEAFFTDLFSNKLMQSLASKLDLSGERLSDRQKLSLELVINMVKFQEYVN